MYDIMNSYAKNTSEFVLVSVALIGQLNVISPWFVWLVNSFKCVIEVMLVRHVTHCAHVHFVAYSAFPTNTFDAGLQFANFTNCIRMANSYRKKNRQFLNRENSKNQGKRL